MKSILKNKKGDFPSLIIGIVIILFVVGIVGVVFSHVFLSILGTMKNETGFPNSTITTITKVESKTIPFLDYFFFFSFVAIFIGLIISSIYIEVHPALTVVFIILLVIAIVLAGIFANVFVSIGETDELSSTYNQFAMTKAIVNNLPLIILFTGIVVILVLYGKSRSGGVPM